MQFDSLSVSPAGQDNNAKNWGP